MTKIISLGKKLSIEEITEFEKQYNVALPNQYKQFMLDFNGGTIEPAVFKISEEKGESVLSAFYAIDDSLRSNLLKKYIYIYDGRLPQGFIPIGKDPGGNLICVSNQESSYDQVYFWDHEEETNIPNDFSNMYFLAENIYEFINLLYEDNDDEV